MSKVAIIMGSDSDLPVMQGAADQLEELGVDHEIDHRFGLEYRGRDIGSHRVSHFVDNRFVVQVLADDREVDGFDRAALRSQLRAADLELGLIINFHRRRLKDGGLVRVLNPDKLQALRGEDEYDEQEAGV